jgi:DNA-binding MarR family transcriptional regulator
MRPEAFGDRDQRLAAGSRLEAARRLLENVEEPDASEGVFNALAMLIVDAALDDDEHSLDWVLSGIQSAAAVRTDADAERFGRLLALADITAWALDRTLSASFLHEFEQSSHAHSFIRVITDRPGISNLDIMQELGVSESEVSRLGRQLIQAGVASKRRLGRRNHWEVTPRGVHMLEVLDSGGVSRYRRPHFQMSS